MSDWKNNRPENWKNPHYNGVIGWPYTFDAYEAGADAMLKALRKEGFDGKLIVEVFDAHTDSKETSIYLDTIQEMMKRYKREQIIKGKWAFIPEESK